MVDESRGAARRAKKPVRTCAACHGTAAPHGVSRSGAAPTSPDEPDGLVRWVIDPEGNVVPDLASRSFGRGAWLHPRRECVKKVTAALSRSFKQQVVTSPEQALGLLAHAGHARALALLGAARRQRLLAVGGQAVVDAVDSSQAYAVVVARDSGAGARLSAVERAVSAGIARGFSTKDELGRLLSRPEVAVLAVLDERLAQSLFGAIALALLGPPDGLGPENRGPDGPGGSGWHGGSRGALDGLRDSHKQQTTAPTRAHEKDRTEVE